MRRILDQYCTSNGLKVWLPEEDDLLFYFDNLLYYHSEHLKLRKMIDDWDNEVVEEITLNQKPSNTTYKKASKLAAKQGSINKYIIAFFTLSIIELSKIFEENKKFQNHLDSKIYIHPYERLRRGKTVLISTLSDKIIHFRDACTHSQIKEISKRPEFKEYNINGRNIHLNFTCDGKTSERVFMIGHGEIKFSDFEDVIKETLNFLYSKN